METRNTLSNNYELCVLLMMYYKKNIAGTFGYIHSTGQKFGIIMFFFFSFEVVYAY